MSKTHSNCTLIVLFRKIIHHQKKFMQHSMIQKHIQPNPWKRKFKAATVWQSEETDPCQLCSANLPSDPLPPPEGAPSPSFPLPSLSILPHAILLAPPSAVFQSEQVKRVFMLKNLSQILKHFSNMEIWRRLNFTWRSPFQSCHWGEKNLSESHCIETLLT